MIYVGSPGQKDALDRIVTIVSSLPEEIGVRFEIVGLNRNQFLVSYKYEKEISNRIHFNGRLSHSDSLKMLFDADFQIFIKEDNITTRAGFPTKFVESISAGVPVLTNLTSNIGDYLAAGVNGYPLDATNDETLRISLIKVLSLPKETMDNLKRSIDRYLFDFRRFIPQIKQFVDNL